MEKKTGGKVRRLVCSRKVDGKFDGKSDMTKQKFNGSVAIGWDFATGENGHRTAGMQHYI